MINYGLKLWSSNSEEVIAEALDLFERKEVDCIEVYNNPLVEFNTEKFLRLKNVPVSIHNTHSHGWHEFMLDQEQLMIWKQTLKMADFFGSTTIVVHPGKTPDIKSFRENLAKIDDPRIFLENMAGLDVYGGETFARTLDELLRLQQIKPICFDFEKAIKSATFQKIDYQDFISDCLEKLEPSYFHISGGDKLSPIDEHKNLWEANFDIAWIKKKVLEIAEKKECTLIFETPKVGITLKNDIKNINFFKQL